MCYKRIGFSQPIVLVLSLFLVLACAALSFAEIKLPAVINDNMVLQEGMKVPIWGWANPGEKIKVKLGQHKVSTTADATGKWTVKLPAMKAGGPYQMMVRGSNTIHLANILVGEVWFCSGQSNMQWPVRRSANAEQEIAAADYPKIRLFTVERNASGQPQSDCVGSWSQCSPETVSEFSAVAYFFGRELRNELGVPVGLIDSSWGGTRIEPWTPPVGFALLPKLQDIRREIRQADSEYSRAVAKSLDTIGAWVEASRKALATNKSVPLVPAWPTHPLSSHAQPTGLYNAMVHPLVPFAIRGALWYQGESNCGDGMMYHEKMKALINGWRVVWGQGDFPFYFVQLAPFRYGGDPLQLPRIWEAQTATLSVPNTGMAVTTDIGNVSDIHPRNKQDVGKRLALWAMARTYGRKEIVYSGPIYKSMRAKGNKIRLSFDYVDGGLVAKGKALTHLTIAAKDKEFVEAEAVIDGDTILVSSDKVSAPVAVRYAWSKAAVPNLFNRAGLPASPFRTDDWPGVKAKKR